MPMVSERERHAAPAGRPQPLAFHAETLWIGCWDTAHLYAVDPATWSVLDDVAAPGKPYGMTSFGGSLRVVISLGENDDRYLYEFVPGRGFNTESKTACPDYTGSHLASNGSGLYLLQATNRRILRIDASGSVLREVALPSPCAGIGFDSSTFALIAADEEFDDLQFATLDLESDDPNPAPIAPLSAESRALAFDGTAWWTSHREQNAIVAFTVAVNGGPPHR